MQTQLDLQGTWQVSLGERDRLPTHYTDKMLLPGTTETAGIGSFALNEDETEHLSRIRPYTGAAWYQREVDIPSSWEGQHIFLELERSKFTSIWVDGRQVSTSDETIVPQRHDLSDSLTAGKHILAICVDNDLEQSPAFPSCLMRGHQYSDHTQTNWNGIIGYMQLSVHSQRYIASAKVMGNVKEKLFEISAEIHNAGDPCTAAIIIELEHVHSGEKHHQLKKQTEVFLTHGLTNVDLRMPIEEPDHWDEFSPAYYNLLMTLHHSEGISTQTIRAAFKDQMVQGKQIHVNGYPIFLRGTVDCAIFPQTGYAPTSVCAWLNVLGIMKDYGINHYRFHSWCPTHAAFEAADQLGIYLQVELPNFATCFASPEDAGHEPVLNRFLHDQAHKILREFGSHPSFFLFATGNEMTGNRECYRALMRECRAYRSDILYTQGANNFLEDPLCIAEDDCWIIMRTSKTDNIRASFSHNDIPLGHLQTQENPCTMQTYDNALALSPLPLIAHEIGQFQTYPNPREIEDYSGPLYPTALMRTKDALEQKGLLPYCDDFVRSSGKLVVDCYREDIEALLRTESMTGFQLLGLQDFPGQGTAMVGILDSFFQSKNLITPAKWQQFCITQVVLAKFSSYTYFAGDNIEIELLVSNYGAHDLYGAPTIEIWCDSLCLMQQALPFASAPRGALHTIGTCTLTLPAEMDATELALRISFEELQTSYPLWVYPNDPIMQPPEGIVISSSLSLAEQNALREGKTVVVFSANAAAECSVEGFYTPDFWCWPMFAKLCDGKGIPSAPGTMGLLIEADHPLFEHFPTHSYAQWQWHAISYHSRPLITDSFLPSVKPIVRVIDNFTRNHNLALVLEANVESGKLLLIASDVLSHLDKPNVRAFYHAAVRYASRMGVAEEV